MSKPLALLPAFDFHRQPARDDFDHVEATVLAGEIDPRANKASRDMAIALALAYKKRHPMHGVAVSFGDLGDLIVPIHQNMSKANILSMLARVRRGQVVWAMAEVLDGLKDSHFDTMEFKSILDYLQKKNPVLTEQFNQALATNQYNSLHGALISMHCELLDHMKSYFFNFEKNTLPNENLRQIFCRPSLLDRLPDASATVKYCIE